MKQKVTRSAPERPAGAVLVGATALMLIGATIGFVAPSLREAPWSDDPQLLAAAVAGNPAAFAWANGFILAAILLTAVALVPISVSFKGLSRPWALTALATFFFAAVFGALDRLISIYIYPWAAQRGLEVTDSVLEAFVRLDESLGGWFHGLAFLALGLYGIAMSKRASLAAIGWLFVAGGAAGIVLELIGAAIPAMVFFGTAALGILMWLSGAAGAPEA